MASSSRSTRSAASGSAPPEDDRRRRYASGGSAIFNDLRDARRRVAHDMLAEPDDAQTLASTSAAPSKKKRVRDQVASIARMTSCQNLKLEKISLSLLDPVGLRAAETVHIRLEGQDVVSINKRLKAEAKAFVQHFNRLLTERNITATEFEDMTENQLAELTDDVLAVTLPDLELFTIKTVSTTRELGSDFYLFAFQIECFTTQSAYDRQVERVDMAVPKSFDHVDQAARAATEMTNMSPHRVAVRLTDDCCKFWNIGDLTVSMAAKPKCDIRALVARAPVHGYTIANGPCSVPIHQPLSMTDKGRDAIAATWQSHLFAVCLTQLKEGRDANQVREFFYGAFDDPIAPPLRARVADHIECGAKVLWNISCTRNAIPSFPTLTGPEATCRAAAQKGNDLVNKTLAQRGRRWLEDPHNALELVKAWYADLLDDLIDEEGLAAIGGKGSFHSEYRSQRQADLDKDHACEGPFCERETHICAAAHQWHSPLKIFSCKEMEGAVCCDCFASQQCHNLKLGLGLTVKPARLLEVDAAKSLGGMSAIRSVEDADQVPRTIFDVYETTTEDVESLAQVLRSSGNRKEMVKALQTICPAVTAEAVAVRQSADFEPHPASYTACLRAITPSLDKSIQFDERVGGDRQPMGHTKYNCRIVPSWLQNKQSAHLFITAITVACIHLRNTEHPQSDGLIRELDAIMRHLGPLDAAYRFPSAHLPEDLLLISRECNSLIEADDAHCDVPHLLALMAKPAPGERPDIHALIAKAPTITSASQRARETAGLRKTSRWLFEQLQRFKSLSEEEEARIVSDINEQLAEEEARLGLMIKRNAAGLPRSFFPRNTPSGQILQLATLALMMDIFFCDFENGQGTEMIIVHDDGHVTRTIILWATHEALHGNRDILTGLTFDLTGRSTSRKPTMIAHRDHGRPALIDDNAVVQGVLVNFLLKSHHISTIITWLKASIPGILRLLTRMRRKGILSSSCSDDLLDAISGRDKMLNDECVDLIKSNRLFPSERYVDDAKRRRSSR